MSDFILSVNDISKSYQTNGSEKLTVLESVDLSIDAGDLVGLTAPSGAGKSTLLHICGLLDTCDSGTINFLGNDLQKASDLTRTLVRRREIGFVYQFHHLLPEFSALENVCIPSWLNKENVNVKAKAKDLLSSMGVIDKINHKPNELSGGERQRVAVARALINRPKIVFADEPSGNLDSDNANQLHNIFFDLRDELNCSFVIVTHNNHLAKRADRIINLKDGQIN